MIFIFRDPEISDQLFIKQEVRPLSVGWLMKSIFVDPEIKFPAFKGTQTDSKIVVQRNLPAIIKK